MTLTHGAVWRIVSCSSSPVLFVLLWTFTQISHSAILTVEFRDDELQPPGPAEFYVFSFSPPLGNVRNIVQVAQNYTTPLIVHHVPPTTAYNVTVFVNDLAKPTHTFVSGPDPPVNLEARSTSSNETVVFWKPPAAGTVDKYRIQLFSRDLAGNVTEGQPLEWVTPKITIAPLYPGGEYSLEVCSVVSSYEDKSVLSEPVRTRFVQPPAAPTRFRRIPSAITESSVSVQWDPAEGVVDAYFVSVQTSIQPNGSFITPTEPLKATFSKLSPGTVYSLALTSVRANTFSKPLFVNATTRPLPPTNLHDTSVPPESRTLHIGWDPPAAQKKGMFYRVTVNGSELNPETSSENRATIANLLPDESYLVSVESFITDVDDLPLYSKIAQGIFHTGLIAFPNVTEPTSPNVPITSTATIHTTPSTTSIPTTVTTLESTTTAFPTSSNTPGTTATTENITIPETTPKDTTPLVPSKRDHFLSCTFRAGMCAWFNAADSQGQWNISHGASSVGIGLPHAPDTSTDTQYLLARGPDQVKQKVTATLRSPVFRFSGPSELSFWYRIRSDKEHGLGSSTKLRIVGGSLSLQIAQNNIGAFTTWERVQVSLNSDGATEFHFIAELESRDYVAVDEIVWTGDEHGGEIIQWGHQTFCNLNFPQGTTDNVPATVV